jgi:hypothetical protein
MQQTALQSNRDDTQNYHTSRLPCGITLQHRESDARRGCLNVALKTVRGIDMHNRISQDLAACQNATDLGLLDAIRTKIVQRLNRAFQDAGR